MGKIDLLTVLVGALLAFLVDATILKKGKVFKRYVASLGLYALMAYIVAICERSFGVTSFWDGILLGLFLWIGFVFASFSLFYLWDQRRFDKKTGLFLLVELVILMMLGAIISG